MLMCDATGLSQRRACRLTGLSLSTCRYEAHRPAADAHLSGRITELALERRRFGYRRIWQLLRREGLHVNHKRVYRLYHLSGLSVKRRRRRKGLATERLPLLRPAAPNLTWSMDFVMDALSTGRRIKCLTCVDDFTKECLTVTVAFGISGVQVTRILDSIALFRGYPATIRTGTVAKLAMRQPFVLFKGLTFQKLCLPGAFRPGDHHNKMLRPGLCVVHASPQYL
ncbi:hypothetical protein STN0717ENT53_P11790 (plasmid) [Enterobacter kobei]|nr:hypothetical protein STN0717ENT53_P11790 [Enterobacter kobei]